MESYITGTPGFQTAVAATPRSVFLNPNMTQLLPRGKLIDGANASDPDNTPDINVLRAGLLMGKITASGFYGASVIGITQGALTSTGTSITLSVAAATELVRRVGSTGTLTLTGPPVASGVVRSLTATYSNVVTSTGVVTITALGVNEVQTLDFTNSPSGTFNLVIYDLNGVKQVSGPITYSATAATLVTNINSAITTALGAGSLVVASGTVVTAIALTFSGTGYAGLPQPNLVGVDAGTLSAGNISVTRTTAGGDGRMISGAYVGPTDGSQIPIAPISSDHDPYGVLVTTNNNLTRQTVPFPNLPITGMIITSQIINYPSDPSLKTWLRTNLSTLSGGKWIFDDQF